MKQQNHYSQALAYLRDYCLRNGRPMHFSRGDIFEAEGAAARLSDFVDFRRDSAIFEQARMALAAPSVGYVESGSFHYLVRRSASCKVTLGSSKNYEGGESTVETVAAGDFVGRSNLFACQSKNYPYCLDGDAAPVTIRADKSCTVYVVDGADLKQHYRQSQEAERIGRDFMAYRLGQVKSHIYSHYCEKNIRDL